MRKRFINLKRIYLAIFIFCFCLFSLPGCQYSRYRIGHPITKPEDLGRIRVTAFVYSNIGPEIRSASSNKKFEESSIKGIWKMLSKEDIYEFVFRENFDPVLPSGKPSRYQIKDDHYSLAREIGRLAYLDYIMVITRGISIEGVNLEAVMVNVETGKSFEARRKFELVSRDYTFWRDLWRGLYKEIFNKVKVDLAITATRKKKGTIRSVPPEKPMIKREERAVKVVKKEEGQEIEKRGKDYEISEKEDFPRIAKKTDRVPKKPEMKVLEPEPPKTIEERKPLPDKAEKIDLLVNDLKTMNLSPVIGLILSEHLRSELFKTNRFRIINRENLKEALKEMGVQMTGIVEETQAVKAGKGLGVKKMVSGSIGHLGDYYTLSLKFINIETLETERMIFEKVKASSEEKLFNTIDLMAQKLAWGSK